MRRWGCQLDLTKEMMTFLSNEIGDPWLCHHQKDNLVIVQVLGN